MNNWLWKWKWCREQDVRRVYCTTVRQEGLLYFAKSDILRNLRNFSLLRNFSWKILYPAKLIVITDPVSQSIKYILRNLRSFSILWSQVLELGVRRQPCAIEHPLCIKVIMGEEKSRGSQREAYERPLLLCCYGQGLFKTEQLFAAYRLFLM